MKIAPVLAAFLLLPQLANAQSAESPTDLDLPIPAWGQAVIDSFSEPVHPVVGSVASGGWLGVGVGYNSPEQGRWYRQAEAMVTVRRYWSLEGEIGRRSLSKQSQLAVFGAVRHMNRLDYFGIGPDTVFENRSVFRLRETTFGSRGWFRPAPAIVLGGSAAIYIPDLGPGANASVPSIETVFLPATVPGFSAEPTFGRYRGFAEVVYPAIGAPGSPDRTNSYRGAYQVAVEAVRDHDSGRHNFHRWETEIQQRIPGLKRGQRLTLHGFLASTNTGSDVPFYMLYTLGGSGGLKSFRPDLLGGDGTRATLRSFRNFRFRDRDLVLMQAEYRIPLMEHVHATVFVDSGQVAPRTSELFKDLRTGTGFSLSYVRNGRSLARVDVGYGGGEGVQIFWSFGAFD
jgi:hypothetical protein